MKFSTPGIPLYPQESPSLADVRTDEMSKEMREEWMQDAQNQQLGSSGIGQSSAYCLIDLMSNYMGGCVKIGHPLNFTGLIKIVSNFDWNFGVYTLVWTHRHTHVGGFTTKDLRSLRSPSAEHLEFLQGDKRIKRDDPMIWAWRLSRRGFEHGYRAQHHKAGSIGHEAANANALNNMR